jgi:delta-aminolevulinic acid dehydratase/porphobilinogen synthase
MYAFPSAQQYVEQQLLDVDGFPELKLKVYGRRMAKTVLESLEQAFFVSKAGIPVARSQLSDGEIDAVKRKLVTQFPEHARIVGWSVAQ